MNDCDIAKIKDFIPLFQVLLGGLLTFLGGIAGNILIQRSQRQSEKRNIASAFAGEIGALLSIVEKRDYTKGIKDIIESIKQTQEKKKFYFKARKNYFNIFEKNAEKIGLLDVPLPEKITTFYIQAFAILEDIENEEVLERELNDIIYFHEELLNLFEETIKLGKEILSIINK
jgi:transcriptional regulator with PAS, ATPase and Fis domain